MSDERDRRAGRDAEPSDEDKYGRSTESDEKPSTEETTTEGPAVAETSTDEQPPEEGSAEAAAAEKAAADDNAATEETAVGETSTDDASTDVDSTGDSSSNAGEKPTDDAGATNTPDESTGSRRIPGLAVIGLVVVTVVALVGVGVLGWRMLDVRAEADARREATKTAEKAADAILAYDHRHLDRDLKRANRYATGTFAKEYEKTSASVLKKTAPDVEAVVKADVKASAVVRADADKVVCLLFVNQSTKSNVREQGVPDRNRVRMTMTKVDGAWKVSDLDAL